MFRPARIAAAALQGLVPPALTLTMALSLAPAAALGEPVSHFRLANGMEVVVIEDHRAPAVVQMVWYKIGSADEPPGHSGIAHFLEHLMFKGTETMPPGAFSARIEDIGGEDNAFTSSDYTAYFQKVAVDNLEMVMAMESDRMRNLRLSDEDVITERDVILEERAQTTESSPGDLLQEQISAALFVNHPYGRPVVGWRHEIEALDRLDALDFYRANYAPNNAILILAGDVTLARARELAELHYQPIPPSSAVTRKPRPQEPPGNAERRVILRDARVAEASLQRHYLAPVRKPGAQREAAALTILAELLGGNGTTSFLAQRLQFGADPIAIWTGAGYDSTGVDSSSFVVYVQPAPDVTLEAAEAALDAALADFVEQGVAAEDLARIKTQVLAARIYGKDDLMGRANDMGASLSVGLGIADVEGWTEELAAVSGEDVLQAARAVLDRRRSVTGWLLPEKGEAE